MKTVVSAVAVGGALLLALACSTSVEVGYDGMGGGHGGTTATTTSGEGVSSSTGVGDGPGNDAGADDGAWAGDGAGAGDGAWADDGAWAGDGAGSEGGSESEGGSAPLNGCGGVCSGMTMTPGGSISTVATFSGSWALCSGQLDVAGPYNGGFPDDTAGIQFDMTSNTAYLLVKNAADELVQGAGLQYQWQVTMDAVTISNGNTNNLSFSNTFTNGLLYYVFTYFPASDGCSSALSLASITSGLPANEPNFVLVSAN
jgi:hypothetical protein